MKPVAILFDSRIIPMPNCGPEDVEAILRQARCEIIQVDLKNVETLDRETADVLVCCYRTGAYTEASLEGMLRFHQEGGGLLFLGDLPHEGAWYPYRNSQASRFFLTRCNDEFILEGLTSVGQSLLGELPALDPWIGRSMKGVRTTAFPPDECHRLLQGRAGFKSVSPVVWGERKREGWLGARFAVVGFDGGLPRENVLGVCNLPEKFSSELLDRSWEGLATMLERLVNASRPPSLAAAIKLDPVVSAGQRVQIVVDVRNLSGKPLGGLTCFLVGGDEGERLQEIEIERLAVGETRSLPAVNLPAKIGPTEYSVRIEESGKEVCEASRHQFGCLIEPTGESGFGFSTYWSFRSETLDESFVSFVQEMAAQGAQYIRFAVNWEDVEPMQGDRDWSIPDQVLALADTLDLQVYFWVFPTARGSGLGDAGIPAWVLREPAMDRSGRPGNFPCIWSPYYRRHYENFLTELTCRYADDPRVQRFVYDFGNSDFAYCYHYYGGPGDEFDYSPYEQVAFAAYLKDHQTLSLEDIQQRWGMPVEAYTEVPIPFPENTDAWLVYNEFRRWGVQEGVKLVQDIIRTHAPDKLPPDLPGHGLGAISDLSTYHYHALARDWDAIPAQEAAYADVHNAARTWGGEPWQVGATFRDYDESLFQSIRLGADYFTIPGPDLGLWEKDNARCAMVRLSLMGAVRCHPEIAIMDRMQWDDTRSLAQVGARLDQPVDLLAKWDRISWKKYRLLVLPGFELFQSPGGPRSLLPDDASFYERLREGVEEGLTVLLFPRTGTSRSCSHLRKALGVESVRYGDRKTGTLSLPNCSLNGMAQAVLGDAERVIWRTEHGDPILVERKLGQGRILLAGFDSRRDSLDAGFDFHTVSHLREHTLNLLLEEIDLTTLPLQTGQACVYKERLEHMGYQVLLVYSHQAEPISLTMAFDCPYRPDHAVELASGRRIKVETIPGEEMYRFCDQLVPETGHYYVMVK